MTQTEIDKIAREFAEETGETSPTTLDIKQRNMERHLEWLSNRYCLVEKSDVKPYCKSRQNILEHQERYDVYIVRKAEVEMKMFRYLFPEIAKEVEP